jgi:hypothetical protein
MGASEREGSVHVTVGTSERPQVYEPVTMVRRAGFARGLLRGGEWSNPDHGNKRGCGNQCQ